MKILDQCRRTINVFPLDAVIQVHGNMEDSGEVQEEINVFPLGGAAVQVQGNMEDSGKEGFTKSL
jgi:hypothetical protein